MGDRKPDFSGYATKFNIRCTDGRTITKDAFRHQDKAKVPLVWSHGHKDPTDVLGHAILEQREDGMYAYCYLNGTAKAEHAKVAVLHQDLDSLSIWANQLVERGANVLHGAIKEVSLVLAGANREARIDNVLVAHGDGTTTEAEDIIIHSGLLIEFEEGQTEESNNDMGTKTDEKTVEHGDTTPDMTVQEVYDSMTPEQQTVLHFMIGEALDSAGIGHSDNDNNNEEGNDNMGKNVFEQTGDKAKGKLSHDAMEEIFKIANRGGGTTLSHAVEEYALAHDIENIEILFPDAKALDQMPEWLKRRTEWVSNLIGAVTKSPFARIKTRYADITADEARAKGYIKGNLKKEEFFKLAGRATVPTTIYKKQSLHRDDVVDITDFDVVAWMKVEMRFMLDEEIARAILIGDGRDISNEDKIDEQCIRPIASDHELYTTTITVNIDDANSSMQEVVDAIILNRSLLKGTGVPVFYTTEYWIARLMIMKDDMGRRLYRNIGEFASEIRCSSVEAVEVLSEEPDIIGILVNPVDYTLGADKGGQVALFDQFDIDYNKQKYLIETRLSGALNRLKSAMVVRKTAGTNTVAAPVMPTFDPETGALTIPTVTGVVYKHGTTTVNAGGSPYSVPAGQTWVIDAIPASGYYFATSDGDQWSFTADN